MSQLILNLLEANCPLSQRGCKAIRKCAVESQQPTGKCLKSEQSELIYINNKKELSKCTPEVRTKWVELQSNGEYFYIIRKAIAMNNKRFSWWNEDEINLMTVPAIEGVPSRSRNVPFDTLDENIDSSTLESLKFCHSESNRDTEADISWDDRGAISVDEETHEEARWWIGYFGVVHSRRWCSMYIVY